MYDVERFIDAQNQCWEQVISELEAEEKRTHWIWFVFPQIKGFSFSKTGIYYSITGIEEAQCYWENDILRERMVQSLNILLKSNKELDEIFSDPDDLKFISSMTLFYEATENELFINVLDHFELKQDSLTLEMLGRDSDLFDDSYLFNIY